MPLSYVISWRRSVGLVLLMLALSSPLQSQTCLAGVELGTSWTLGPHARLPHFLRLANGTVLLSHSLPTGPAAAREPYVAKSLDDGQSWWPPVRVAVSSGPRLVAGGMAQLPNGDVLFVYHDGNPVDSSAALHDSDSGRLRVARSQDGGETWQDFSIVHQTPVCALWEGVLTYLPDGRLLCHFASEENAPTYPNAIFQSVSWDGGATWSPPTQIIGLPGSRDGVPSVVRIPSGRLLCFFEGQEWADVSSVPCDFIIRYEYSDDEGASWSGGRYLVSKPSSTQAYHRHTAPYATLLPNGKVLVAFYSSEGYAPRPYDVDVDIAYVEADPPYTRWTNARHVTGLPGESDRWGSFLPLDNERLLFTYNKAIGGSAADMPIHEATYNYCAADNFADRIELNGLSGTATAANIMTTKESGEPWHAGNAGGRSAWWKWTAPATGGSVQFSAAGANFDCLVGAYSGSSLGTLVPVGLPRVTSATVAFSTQPGAQYAIAVDGANATSGFIPLLWSFCTAGPEVPSGPNPAEGGFVSSIPFAFSWSPSTSALSYGVLLDGVLAADGLTTSQWRCTTPIEAGPHTWQVRAHNACGDTTGASWSFTAFDLDLVAANFSPATPISAQPGQSVTCSWTVSGPPVYRNIWYEFFASRTGGLDIDRLGGTVTNSPAAWHNGGEVTFSPTDQVLNDMPDGIYTIVAAVNRRSVSTKAEVDYTNNLRPIAGKRLFVHNTNPAVSDLAWLTTPTLTVSGGYFSTSGTLINRGTGASPSYGFWNETAYGVLTGEGAFLPAGYIGAGIKVMTSVAPGQTAAFAQAGYVPAGDWAFAVMADSTDLVAETNETNNYVLFGTPPVPPSGTVDLEITSASLAPSMQAPNELSQSGRLAWSCAVHNNSATDSGDVWFETFASQTGGLDTIRAGTSLTWSEKRNIPAGQTRTFSFNQRFNEIPDGIYTIVAMANRQWTGGPTDPKPVSNRYVMPGRIFLHNPSSAAVNLVWVAPPAVSLDAGRNLTITGTVRNDGTTTSGSFWAETFYGSFSGDGFFGRQGQMGGGQRCEFLAPGATWAFAQTEYLPTGTWVVAVPVDSTDIVPETNETDNYHYVRP
jgi:hypothetical protein